MASLAEIATSLEVGPMVLAPPVAATIYGLLVWDAQVLLPKTNVEQFPRVRRLVAGIIALFGGIAFVEAFVSLTVKLLAWPSWNAVAASIAAAITTAGSMAAGSYFLALCSGLDVPPLRALAPRQLPPMHR